MGRRSTGLAEGSSAVRSLRCLAVVLALALPLAACNDDSPSESPAPTPTPVPRVTDTFTGTFGQNGAASHSFTVSQVGDVELKLTAIAPLATLSVGMGIGQVDTTLTPPCRNFAEDANVRVNETLLSGNLAAGTYCVRVRDTGNVFPGVVVDYTVTVTHP
jgi:hypothetical protein